MSLLISVILPVYNCEKYIVSAINSILIQTYTNFELIIIDDGSTDSTSSLINSLTDYRIKYYKNEVNSGLAFTLNRGISISKGEFIARMDGDDIAHNERFSKQISFLLNNTGVDMIDCLMEYIDEDGKSLNKLNSNVVSSKDIKNILPKENCLGHSSILIRAEILRKYRYNNIGNEDYELWLRLVADGIVISKINEVLLFYRIHNNSYTSKAHVSGKQFFRQANSKLLFIKQEWLEKHRYSFFSLKVIIYMFKDYATGIYKNCKIKLLKSN